jgi:hypothetical protein
MWVSRLQHLLIVQNSWKHKDVVFIRTKASVLVLPAMPVRRFISSPLLFCLAPCGPVRTPSLKLTLGIVRLTGGLARRCRRLAFAVWPL